MAKIVNEEGARGEPCFICLTVQEIRTAAQGLITVSGTKVPRDNIVPALPQKLVNKLTSTFKRLLTLLIKRLISQQKLVKLTRSKSLHFFIFTSVLTVFKYTLVNSFGIVNDRRLGIQQ